MKLPEQEVKDVLATAQVLRIAMNGDDFPYCVPVCFGYRDRTIYIHAAPRTGKKDELLARDHRVCFECETGVEIRRGDNPCRWGMKFKSVIGIGDAMKVLDEPEKKRALSLITEHYTGSGHEFTDEECRTVTIYKIQVLEATGKAR